MKTPIQQYRDNVEEFDLLFVNNDGYVIGFDKEPFKKKTIEDKNKTHTLSLIDTIIEKFRGKMIRNNPKQYDGNDLESAMDLYLMSVDSWAEIIRYEEGHDKALQDTIDTLQELKKGILDNK